MPQTESVDFPRPTIYSFDQTASDVNVVAPGETVEVTNFTEEFDPLVISLINAATSSDLAVARSRVSETFYTDQNCPRPLGTFAVQQSLGLDPLRNRLKFTDWPATNRAPSQVLLRKNFRGVVPSASVTVLDRIAEERSIDLLLQAHVRTSAHSTSTAMTRLVAQRDSRNKLHVNYPAITDVAAAHAVAAALQRT